MLTVVVAVACGAVFAAQSAPITVKGRRDLVRYGCFGVSPNGQIVYCVTYVEGHHSGRFFQHALLRIPVKRAGELKPRTLKEVPFDGPLERRDFRLLAIRSMLKRQRIDSSGIARLKVTKIGRRSTRIQSPDRSAILIVDLVKSGVRITVRRAKGRRGSARTTLVENPDAQRYWVWRAYWLSGTGVFAVFLGARVSDPSGSSGSSEIRFFRAPKQRPH